MREAIEEAFWNFIDQKWRDALNVAADRGGRILSQLGGFQVSRRD
jgi:hypothetical protein